MLTLKSHVRNNFQVRIVIATAGIMGLAEGVNNDTCLVTYNFA